MYFHLLGANPISYEYTLHWVVADDISIPPCEGH